MAQAPTLGALDAPHETFKHWVRCLPSVEQSEFAIHPMPSGAQDIQASGEESCVVGECNQGDRSLPVTNL